MKTHYVRTADIRDRLDKHVQSYLFKIYLLLAVSLVVFFVSAYLDIQYQLRGWMSSILNFTTILILFGTSGNSFFRALSYYGFIMSTGINSGLWLNYFFETEEGLAYVSLDTLSLQNLIFLKHSGHLLFNNCITLCCLLWRCLLFL